MSSNKQDKIICPRCGSSNTKRQLYKSQSDLYKYYEVIPICKKCITNMYGYIQDKYQDDTQSIYELCRLLDVPFNRSALEAAQAMILKNGWMIHQAYITQINSLGGGNNYGTSFADSEPYESYSIKKTDSNLNTDKPNAILEDLVFKWGDGYSYTEIMQLEKFYKDMMLSHDISLPQHKKMLITMCKMNRKMDECLENNDLTNFSKLHAQYQKLLQSAGFRPIDNKGSSDSAGIKTFSQIFEEVERDGFIKPTPISEHQDIVDKTIQYEMNYMLKLLQQQPLTEPPIDTPKVDDVDG